MALGRQGLVQDALLIGWHEVPSAPGHVVDDRLNGLLDGTGFDREVEAPCRPHYAGGVGRPSIPPGRYFRMLFVGYFEGLDSERGIAWRCADSLSLRRFLKLGPGEAVPDHGTLSRTRARLPLEVHDAVFALVLGLLADRGLITGRRVGIDASTMEASAAMRAIVRREAGASWQAMLGELARTGGIATPSADQLRQSDRARPKKRVSNGRSGCRGPDRRVSPSDPEARITRMKAGRTRLVYKSEHTVGLDTGAILAAPVHPGDAGDTRTLEGRLEPLDLTPSPQAPAKVVADMGEHGREVLKRLDAGPWTTRIAEPARRSGLRWHGDTQARRAVYANRTRRLSGVARVALVLRAVLCERASTHVLDRGALRRTWLRGRENVTRRYLVHIAAYDLGLVMRALLGAGTPRAAADLRLLWLTDRDRCVLVVVAVLPARPATFVIATTTPHDPPLSTVC